MGRRLLFRVGQSFCVAAIVVTTVLPGQPSPIGVSAGTHISTDSPNVPFAETFLALNPRNPQNLIATSMIVANGALGARVYASTDGGRSWRRTIPDADEKGGDPVVYFDADGTAFFGLQVASGFRLNRSTDGGLTWEPAVTLRPGRGWDRAYIAFDNTGGRFNGRVYVGATITANDVNGKQQRRAIVVLSSQDHGRTFSPGTVLDGQAGGIADMVVTPDGKLLVMFGAGESYPDSSTGSSRLETLATIISEDGGVSFSPAQMGPVMREARGFRMIKSLGGFRAAIDLSQGQYRGRIYALWNDFDEHKYIVKVMHTDDLGRTWSSPTSVSDNTNDSDPANPALAINKDGVVGVVFNDRRDDAHNSCFRLYFAASFDGGDSFLPNAKASDHPTCPAATGNWAPLAISLLAPPTANSSRRLPLISMATMATRFPNGGDTQGLVAGSDGVFRSAWINGESGVMQLWFKEISVGQRPTAADRTSQKDLSRDLTLELSNPTIDLQSHTVCVGTRISNPLPSAVTGPFALILEDVGGELSDLRALNSDNHLPAKGATWNFIVRDNGALQTDDKSEERSLCWQFTKPANESNRVPFFAHFLILGSGRQ